MTIIIVNNNYTNVRNSGGPRPRTADGLSTTNRMVRVENLGLLPRSDYCRTTTFAREIRLSGKFRPREPFPDAVIYVRNNCYHITVIVARCNDDIPAGAR